jgi:uncharacterized iron-regulated membrane protein
MHINKTRFFRQWHRWIGWIAALFLTWAGGTGVIVAAREFWGADEALREVTRALVSPVQTTSAAGAVGDPVARVMASAAKAAPGAPIDKIEVQFKGKQPTVTVFTGKPAGGEDRKLVFDATTGALLRNEDYADKPFLTRLHSGEAFGDGGLVVGMLWGFALVLMSVSGIVIYLRMHRPNRIGLKKVFW